MPILKAGNLTNLERTAGQDITTFHCVRDNNQELLFMIGAAAPPPRVRIYGFQLPAVFIQHSGPLKTRKFCNAMIGCPLPPYILLRFDPELGEYVCDDPRIATLVNP